MSKIYLTQWGEMGTNTPGPWTSWPSLPRSNHNLVLILTERNQLRAIHWTAGPAAITDGSQVQRRMLANADLRNVTITQA